MQLLRGRRVAFPLANVLGSTLPGHSQGGAAAPSTRLEVASNSAGVNYSDFAMIL